MRNIKDKISFFILSLAVFLAFLYYLYNFHKTLVNSNFAIAVVTLSVGLIAILLYIIQKKENKRDAARTILQEIRRAEKIIADYKEHGHFKFTKKIIVTNSWAKNIHYFVDDLHVDKLDKISDLYSTGEYLDSVIKMVSDIKFDQRIHERITKQARDQVNQKIQPFFQQLEDKLKPQTMSLPVGPGDSTILQRPPLKEYVHIDINLAYDSVPTEILFNEIVSHYEPIYYTDIVEKLKKIAQIK